MRLQTSVLCLTLAYLPRVLAVFADEAYHIDYHHELLGVPQPHTSFFHRPRKEDKATLVYTLSDLGVLGAVNPATGKIVWRQFLAKNGSDGDSFLRPVEGESTVVSGVNNRVESWDAMSGRERWGSKFAGQIKDLEIIASSTWGSEASDVLALFEENGNGILRKIKGSTGEVVWEHKDESTDVPFQVSTNAINIFIVSLQGPAGGHSLKVTTLDPVSGQKTKDYILQTKSDVHGAEDVLIVGANSAAPIIAWTDKGLRNLKVNILGKAGHLDTLPLKESDEQLVKVTIHAPHLVQSLPHFLVHSQSKVSNRADVYHIDIARGTIAKAYELPKLAGLGAVSVSSQDAMVYFTRLTTEEVVIFSSESHAILGRWPVKVEKDHGHLLHSASEVVQRSPGTYAVRSAVVTTNDDWVLIRNGAEAWTRVEGLSGVVAAEWAEIPESEALAKTLELEAHSNPLTAYIHRVKRHVHDLQYLPNYLYQLPARFLSSILPGDAAAPKSGVLLRDGFGFNKLVIVATQRGRVYGLDAGNHGNVIWTWKAFDIPAGQKWDVKGIWVENSRGVATIRGSNGEYILIQAATGINVETMSPGSWPPVQSSALVDSESGKWLLPIGLDGNPGEIPASWAPKDVLVVQGKNGEVKGLKFEVKGANAEPTTAWIFQPAAGQKVVNIVAKPAHDPVASIGRVLGDRSVLYKFLNPNTVLVTAVSKESATATFHLLDTVSGDILYSVSHKGVDTKRPIPSVLTENWLAYSFWSDIVPESSSPSASKGYQLIVSDLYESSIPNDRGPLGETVNASSLEPSDIPNAGPALPYVVSQSFLVPQGISHMSVTQTRQGITSRALLCTLASGAIVSLPRYVLDPRRPVGRAATPAEAEEGLFQYHPFLEFDPKQTITHKREIIGIRKVITSPALLESTSLVFAYGVDVFGTRVTPSAAFDILGKAFNKVSLVATVLALGAAVGVLAPMVKRKQINGRWQT